ncbi:hypothetical protein DFH07DRAFT_852852 [Mycena maculata]|uniref:GPI anchored protein n=1 Tax=Mycena maculata TaxID=230809 RepID=A0AAD7MPH0_9AGAR|nr:hypothetical protein DFH07DRAFT_852852 [Mycena maculata]
MLSLRLGAHLLVANLLVGAYGDSLPGKRIAHGTLKPQKRHPVPLQSGAGVISGLLYPRQSCDPGYGACKNTASCCPIGGDCCTNGGCCAAGQWCYAKICCTLAQDGCDNSGCCNIGETCCQGGGCCAGSDYCVADGCCPTGETCTGSSDQCDISGYVPCANEDWCCLPGQTCSRDSNGDPSCGGSGGGSPTTKATTTTHGTTTAKATTTAVATTAIATPTTIATQVTTETSGGPGNTHSTTNSGTALTSVPTAPAGSQNVVINVLDAAIIWTGDWVVVASSCSASNQAKAVSGNDSSIADVSMQYSFTGSCIYLSIASNNAGFGISIDGELTEYGENDNSVTTPTNCTFGWSRTNLTATVEHTFEIFANGPSSISNSRRDAGDSWVLEVQNLVITQPNASASTTGNFSAASKYSIPGYLLGTSVLLLFLFV